MGFAAAQGGEAKISELALQVPYVVASQANVGGQVCSAGMEPLEMEIWFPVFQALLLGF